MAPIAPVGVARAEPRDGGRPRDGGPAPPAAVRARTVAARPDQGETGVGKGLLARSLHRAGPRASGPFVDVNCAAIPETLLEAELFGYERGAFTDARHAKAGLFQTANHGTIFLDEVGLLPEALQAKLLKALEDRAVRRLGSTRSEPVDVWIVTASNENLAIAARARRFREDLYHRLAVVTLTIPPLLAGRGRAPPGGALPRAGVRGVPASPAELRAGRATALLAYPWPGNVRELANVMERVALLSEAPVVSARSYSGCPPCRRRPRPRTPGPGRRGRSRPRWRRRWAAWSGSISSKPCARRRATSRAGSRALRHLAGHPPVPHGEARPGTRGTGPARTSPHEPARPAHPARRVDPARSRRVSGAGTGGRPGRDRRAAGGPMGGPAARVPPKRPRPAGRQRSRVQPEPRGLETLVEKIQTFGGRIEEMSPDGHRRGVRAGADRGRSATRRAGGDGRPQGRGAGRRRRGRHPGPLGDRRPPGAGRVLPRRTQVDLDGKREAWTALDTLLRLAEPGAILVEEAAAVFLARHFDLAPVHGADTAGPVHRLVAAERPGVGRGRRPPTFVGRGRTSDSSGAASTTRSEATVRSWACSAKPASESRACSTSFASASSASPSGG